MTALPINLDWYKDGKGYRLVDYGKYAMRIAGNGGRLVPFRPFDKNDLVFFAFAKVDSPQSLLKFVERYGLLDDPKTRGSVLYKYEDGVARLVDSARTLMGEQVASHLETAELFRSVLLQAEKGWHRVPEQLEYALGDALNDVVVGEITLAGDRKRGLRMCLRATSLMHGLWLQLAKKIAGEAAFRICAFSECGELFEVRSSDGLRADARFCSSAHRVKFNSLKRSKRS
jgi:hypothetical protein